MRCVFQLTAKTRLQIWFIVLAEATFMSGGHAAAQATWSGGSAIPSFNNNWSNPFNWESGFPPLSNGEPDVIIPDTPRDNPVVDAAWDIRSLEFTETGTYSLSGQPLTLRGGLTNSSIGTVTINNSLNVAGNQNWTAANGPIVINGAITGTASDFDLVGPHAITLDGTAANTFADTISVTSGTLILSRQALNNAILDDLLIGQSSGTPGSAVVRWDDSDQISDAAGIILNVNRTGVADLNNKVETLSRLAVTGTVESNGGKLTVNVLTLGGGQIDLGAGELVLGDTVFNVVFITQSTMTASLVRLAAPHTEFDIGGGAAAVEAELNGVIADSTSGASQLRKMGNGTLRLTGASTYSGGTLVLGGELRLDNTNGSGGGSGEIVVFVGGRLEGNGSTSGRATISGGATLAPGAPIGSLELGALTLSDGAIAQFQISGATQGVSYDTAPVAGAAALNGTMNVELAGFTPTASQTFTLISASTLSGAFDNAAAGTRLATTDGGGSFVVNYGAGSPFGASAVVLSDFRFSADFDEDGNVDAADFNAWKSGFGADSGATHAQGDANGDGDVDGDDMLVWQRQFGLSLPMVAAVPEPGMPAVIGALLAAAAVTRRR
jgi:autotransporter-associated beta strand protein